MLGRLIGTVFGIFKKNQAKMNFLKSGNEDVAISVREVPLWGLLSKFDNYCLGYFPFKEWTTTIAKLENNFKQVNKAIKDEVDDFIRNPERLPNPDNIPTPYMHAAEGSKRAYTLYVRLNPYTKNGFFLLFQGLVRILHPLVYLALFLLIFSLISVFTDLYLPVEVYVIGFAILGLWLMSDLLALVVRKAFRLDAKSLGLSTEEREKAKEGDFDATHPHFIGKDNRACDDVKNWKVTDVFALLPPYGVLLFVVLLVRGIFKRTFPTRAFIVLILAVIGYFAIALTMYHFFPENGFVDALLFWL